MSMMVTGQTVANMLGVPAGTLLSEMLSWRLAFAILAAWALMTMVLVIAWVPFVAPIKDAGIKGQFRFLTHAGPWFILMAVFCGNSGIFCWWSYVSPWLQKVGGWDSSLVPLLMVLAGFGMVIGGIAGGRLTDLWKPGATAGAFAGHCHAWLVAGVLCSWQSCDHRSADIPDWFRTVLQLVSTAAADGAGR